MDALRSRGRARPGRPAPGQRQHPAGAPGAARGEGVDDGRDPHGEAAEAAERDPVGTRQRQVDAQAGGDRIGQRVAKQDRDEDAAGDGQSAGQGLAGHGAASRVETGPCIVATSSGWHGDAALAGGEAVVDSEGLRLYLNYVRICTCSRRPPGRVAPGIAGVRRVRVVSRRIRPPRHTSISALRKRAELGNIGCLRFRLVSPKDIPDDFTLRPRHPAQPGHRPGPAVCAADPRQPRAQRLRPAQRTHAEHFPAPCGAGLHLCRRGGFRASRQRATGGPAAYRTASGARAGIPRDPAPPRLQAGDPAQRRARGERRRDVRTARRQRLAALHAGRPAAPAPAGLVHRHPRRLRLRPDAHRRLVRRGRGSRRPPVVRAGTGHPGRRPAGQPAAGADRADPPQSGPARSARPRPARRRRATGAAPGTQPRRCAWRCPSAA